MTSRNGTTVQAPQAAFNQRDWGYAHGVISTDCIFTDPTGADHKGVAGYVNGYVKSWVEGFSDAKATDVKIHDAGGTIVAEFVGIGTSDGPLGSFPATGKRQVDFGLLPAGAVLAMISCVILFLALQRYYVAGLTAGAVKG